MLKDENGDSRADKARTVAARPGMHGIFVQDRKAYVATDKDVYVAEVREVSTARSERNWAIS